MTAVPGGRRSTFVEIQRATETRDPVTKAKVQTWGKIGEAWVSFLPMRGTEDYIDSARVAQRVIRIEGDFLEFQGVRENDRLLDVDNNRIVDIKTILPGQDFRDKVRIEGTQGEGAR